MACRLYNTERCLQLQLFNRPNFGVHFNSSSRPDVYGCSRTVSPQQCAMFYDYFFVI